MRWSLHRLFKPKVITRVTHDPMGEYYAQKFLRDDRIELEADQKKRWARWEPLKEAWAVEYRP